MVFDIFVRTLVNGTQFCDICNRAILLDERCVRGTISKERAEQFLSLFSRTGNAMPSQIEPDGTVLLTICLDCKLNMAGVPNEFIN
jgi:hypothetical protein